MESEHSNPIIFYDGVCGLCNRLVRFVLKHDSRAKFRFASLQSQLAATVLRQHRVNPDDLDTMYLVSDYQQSTERLASRSDAVILILRGLGGFWRTLAALFGLAPHGLRDWSYNLIARNRYRIFGKYESCMLPEEKYRHRFLDI
ncbi:MAG: thiol-disulfide oxidoreductase DCC [Acidobacteria bacterium]|nr:MAG: thiol-disulfide oxidoreductase DCC [Acidobacteriota bacterium]